MNNFFKTLIEPNLPNGMKLLGGLVVAALAVAASGVIPGLPVWVVIGASALLGSGAIAGGHALHRMDCPETPIGDR